jgi:hypothetical protein
MTANHPHTPEKPHEPGFIERAIHDLQEHYEHGEHGDHTGYERPEVEAEEKIDPTKLGAEGFQHLVEKHDQEKQDQRQTQREAAADQRQERVEELKEQHVGDDRWKELMRRACEAAKAGETEFELLRFPSQLCSDGGRAINMSEEGWPDTLRGEARELHERWERDLKPQGFRLTAKILDFPDGVPGDAGLFLSWGV